MKRIYQENEKTYIWTDEEYAEVKLTTAERISGYGTRYDIEIDLPNYNKTIPMWVTDDDAVFLPWDWEGTDPNQWTADDQTKAIMLDGLPRLSPWQRNPNVTTVPEACKVLGITKARAKQLIDDGTLKAQKDGRDWLVWTDDVAHYWIHRRRPGQPKKTH
jgi:excisionase family DNA binding protein